MVHWEVKGQVDHYGILGSTVGAGRHCGSLRHLHEGGDPGGGRPRPVVGHSPMVENR